MAIFNRKATVGSVLGPVTPQPWVFDWACSIRYKLYSL